MRRKIISVAFAISLLWLTCSFSRADEMIKLKFANYLPPMHMSSVIMGKFCEEMNEKLSGKVEITYYPGGTLLAAPKIAAGVASGIADIGLAHCAYTRGRFPAMELMELPIGFPSSWIATHVANDFYNKFKPKEWDAFHPLMFSTSPPNVLQTLNKQVNTLDDMKGLKIRGTGRIGDIVKSLGAIPMPIEAVDTYEALRRGVLDGNMGPLEQLKSFKFGEVEKYATASWKIGNVFAFYVIMNKEKWNRLPPDVQTIISEFSKGFIERWASGWNNVDIEGGEYFKSQGGQIVFISDEEVAKFRNASQTVIEDFKKDLVSKGYQASEIDEWLSFVRERIEYWKAQEKVKNIPTAYQY